VYAVVAAAYGGTKSQGDSAIHLTLAQFMEVYMFTRLPRKFLMEAISIASEADIRLELGRGCITQMVYPGEEVLTIKIWSYVIGHIYAPTGHDSAPIAWCWEKGGRRNLREVYRWASDELDSCPSSADGHNEMAKIEGIIRLFRLANRERLA